MLVRSSLASWLRSTVWLRRRGRVFQVALAVPRVLDNPRAVNQHAAAAKVLSVLLDKLRSVSARGRRGGLAVVRTMTEKGGA